MKKMKVVRSRKRFFEGGEMPSIPREPLRDSSGDIVRDSSGEAVMSGSTRERTESGPKGYLDDDIKGPSKENKENKEDNGIRQRPVQRPPGATPIKNVDIDESDRRREEIEKLPQKEKPNPEKKPEKKPESKPEAKPPGRTASGKTAEQEEEGRKKFEKRTEKKSDEVPNVEKIKKEQEGTSEGTSTSEKLKSGLSDTAEKVLGATGAAAGAAALGRQAYKMAKAPLGFMGEAKRMASNVGQSLRNAVSGRKPSAAGEGAEAAAQATKSVGPSQFDKAKTAAQRARNTKFNKRDAKQPKLTDDERDLIRMGSDMKRGGKVSKYAKGGSIGSASRRGDGIAMRGKTRGKMF